MAPSSVFLDSVRDLPLELDNEEYSKKAPLSSLTLSSHDSTDYVLRVFRCLIVDLCEQFKGGHPG